MANQKLLKIVRRGKQAVAVLRHKHPTLLIDLIDADLKDADLHGVNLQRADLIGADLTGANLADANLAAADLTRARLCQANLTRANLQRANAFRADLTEANLANVDAKHAKFRNTTLRQARCENANFTSVDFTGSDWADANLPGADLTHSRLLNVNASQTVFGDTRLGHVDLSRVIQLESARHVGPSSLGIDSLYQSAGQIPEKFLAGCGVPSGLIETCRSLVEQPFANVTCMIIHSPEDQSFAAPLHAALTSKGIRCWQGEKTPDCETAAVLPREITAQDRFLFCASKSSLARPWSNPLIQSVLSSEERIKAEEKRTVQILIPLNLDGFMFSGDWKSTHEKRVAARVAGDFVGWRRNKSKFMAELEHVLTAIDGRDKKQTK